ncbi:hypothetical protein Ancab_025504 [Ancistrocladus abbreviatus]
MLMESSVDLLKKLEGEYLLAYPFDLCHMKDPLCCIRQDAPEAAAMVERNMGEETSMEKSFFDVEIAGDKLDLTYLEVNPTSRRLGYTEEVALGPTKDNETMKHGPAQKANQNQEEDFRLRNNSETSVELEALEINNVPGRNGGDLKR